MGTNSSSSISVSDPNGYEYGIKFNSKKFNQGTHRNCYIGTLVNEKAPQHKKKVILKVWKPKYNFADYECVLDLKKSIKCHEYSLKYNDEISNNYTNNNNSIPIIFDAPLRININQNNKNKSVTASVTNDANPDISAFNNMNVKIDSSTKYLTVYSYLPSYTQYTSNNGWCINDNKYTFLSSFSHYSWVKSRGLLLICAFRGTHKNDILYLTDSVIHSISNYNSLNQYGLSDLGIIGIINYFIHHKCDNYCKHLPKLDINQIPIHNYSIFNDLKPNKSVSYIFELNKDKNDIIKDNDKLKLIYMKIIKQLFDNKHVQNMQIIEEKIENCDDIESESDTDTEYTISDTDTEHQNDNINDNNDNITDSDNNIKLKDDNDNDIKLDNADSSDSDDDITLFISDNNYIKQKQVYYADNHDIDDNFIDINDFNENEWQIID